MSDRYVLSELPRKLIYVQQCWKTRISRFWSLSGKITHGRDENPNGSEEGAGVDMEY